MTQSDTEDQTKQCVQCGLIKSTDDFYADPSSSDGKRSTCKVCFNRHRRTDRTDRTTEDGPIENGESSPESDPPDPSYSLPRTNRTADWGRFGVEVNLTVPDLNYSMSDIKLCPCCHSHDVMFDCELVGGGLSVPFLSCNGCILRASYSHIRFFIDSGTIFIVSSVDTGM